MLFRTASGAEYALSNIGLEPSDALPDYYYYSAGLSRVGEEVIDQSTGLPMEIEWDEVLVTFKTPPKIGDRFMYWIDDQVGVLSSVVKEIHE